MLNYNDYIESEAEDERRERREEQVLRFIPHEPSTKEENDAADTAIDGVASGPLR